MGHIVSCTRACPSLFSDRSRSGSANVPGAGSPHSWEESGPAHRERESTVARCRSLVSVVLYGESTRVLSREIHVTEGDASEGMV